MANTHGTTDGRVTADNEGGDVAHGPDETGHLNHLGDVDASGVRLVSLVALAVGAVAFVILAVMAAGQPGGVRDIFLGYLSGYTFWFMFPFGAAGLTLLGYLGSASWGVVLRRCFRAAIKTWPLMTVVLFAPVAAGLYVNHGTDSPYWWADSAWRDKTPEQLKESKGVRVEGAEENQEKVHDILNPTYFLVISSVIFVVIGVISTALNFWGRKAEADDDTQSLRNLKGISGPGFILWVLSLTVLSTIWVMSVEPTWASSMFPIVFAMDAFVITLSVSIFVFYSVNAHKQDVLGIVKDKFRIDMGTMLMTFTMVWAYASFGQYMLIWAGNLPEELVYYRKRGNAGWEYLAYFLMLFHWLIPFVVLLFREVKTDPRYMRALCVMLALVCLADVIWWLVPAVEHPSTVLHVPLALAATLMVGGAFGALFAYYLGQAPTLPKNREGRFLATWGHHH